MYISNNCRDYNAAATSRELMYVLDNNIYTKLNKKDGNFIYQLNADDKTIPVIKDEKGQIYYNKNAITGKKIDICYDNCYIIENDKLFYLDNNQILCAYDNATSEKLDLNYFNKINIYNCFKFFEGNIITYKGLEGFKMYNNKGELLWGFYNQNMFIDPFGKTHGSDTFYNEFIIYKGYIIVASCIGNMIFKIKINGSDFEYLGINSLNFVIIDDMICYKDNYDFLNNLNIRQM